MLKQQLSDLLRNQTKTTMVEQASLERISFLEAMLETMPIGVIVAEAPSGRITMGNSYAEELLGQSIYTSENVDSYGEWNSFYADGSRVQSHEYPLAKVIRENVDYAELDVQYHRGDGTRVWIRIIGRPVLADDGSVRGATIALVDIDNERHLMDQQNVMIAELNHRVKNAFTVVKSIVSQSLRGTDTPPAARETIDDRLDAYAKAHSQLIGNRWDRAEIGRIVEDTIGRIAGGRIEVSGTKIEVPSRIAMALSMAIYELGTNAVKHGSLSMPQGRVLMDWAYVSPGNDLVRITWTELDGPEPVVPTTKGFGSKIIDQILAAETEGTVVIDYPQSGFTWCLELPLSQKD
ncbi:HWE histidine kinase domain-containing protein [Sulfitobacter sp. HNIBRBA2951]|uniref:HWE histidine kinase domain-containing protein n=1 Tax=Sulfitobacter aquimarinus TaxID=3158557 RepID=UPI0032DF6E22